VGRHRLYSRAKHRQSRNVHVNPVTARKTPVYTSIRLPPGAYPPGVLCCLGALYRTRDLITCSARTLNRHTHTHRMKKRGVAHELKDANWITNLKHPAQSLNLNPIEGIWNIIKQRLRRRIFHSSKELKDAIQEEWDKIMSKMINCCTIAYLDSYHILTDHTRGDSCTHQGYAEAMRLAS
jgi:hypothetical protein